MSRRTPPSPPHAERQERSIFWRGRFRINLPQGWNRSSNQTDQDDDDDTSPGESLTDIKEFGNSNEEGHRLIPYLSSRGSRLVLDYASALGIMLYPRFDLLIQGVAVGYRWIPPTGPNQRASTQLYSSLPPLTRPRPRSVGVLGTIREWRVDSLESRDTLRLSKSALRAHAVLSWMRSIKQRYETPTQRQLPSIEWYVEQYVAMYPTTRHYWQHSNSGRKTQRSEVRLILGLVLTSPMGRQAVIDEGLIDNDGYRALQREIDILEHIGDLRRVTIDEGVDELEPVPLTNQEASMEESEVVSLLGVDSINVEETVMPYDTSSDTPSMDSWYYSATESIFHPLDPS